MGLTYVRGKVKGKNGRQTCVRFLVDSGASYTLLSEKVWRAIGLKPKRRVEFSLADGTPITRAVSECFISIPQGEGHTPVILGEAGDEPLLGTITLEELGLTLNQFNRTLQPMRALLM